MAYKTVTPPVGGKIFNQNGKLNVPDNPILPFIRGDGTGPDIWAASQRVFDAAVLKAYGAKRKVVWFEVFAGETAFNMHDAVFDDLYAVQFCQEQPGVAEFRYVAGPRFHSSRLARIEEGIRRKLGDDFQITFREVNDVEKTPGGKHRWLVSKLPDAGTTAG